MGNAPNGFHPSKKDFVDLHADTGPDESIVKGCLLVIAIIIFALCLLGVFIEWLSDNTFTYP